MQWSKVDRGNGRGVNNQNIVATHIESKLISDTGRNVYLGVEVEHTYDFPCEKGARIMKLDT